MEIQEYIARHRTLLIGLFGFVVIGGLALMVIISTAQGRPPCWRDQVVNGKCPNWPQNNSNQTLTPKIGFKACYIFQSHSMQPYNGFTINALCLGNISLAQRTFNNYNITSVSCGSVCGWFGCSGQDQILTAGC